MAKSKAAAAPAAARTDKTPKTSGGANGDNKPIRHLYLVDGSGYLFRAYHALPPMTRPDGTPVRRASFKIFDFETGKLKRSGHVTHLIREVSRSRFDTPAGRIDGYYISMDHRMDMKYAELDMTLGLGFRDDGPIFGAGQYTLTKLGIFKATQTASAALTPLASDR